MAPYILGPDVQFGPYFVWPTQHADTFSNCDRYFTMVGSLVLLALYLIGRVESNVLIQIANQEYISDNPVWY